MMPRWGRSAVLSCDISSGPRENGGKESISSAISKRPDVSPVVASKLGAVSHTSVFDSSFPLKSGSQVSALMFFFSFVVFVFFLFCFVF